LQHRPCTVCEMHSAPNHFVLTGLFLDLGYFCNAFDPNHILATLE